MQRPLCLLLCPPDGLLVDLKRWESVNRQKVHICLLLRQDFLYFELDDQCFGLGLLVFCQPVDRFVGEEFGRLDLHEGLTVGKLGLPRT